jgi:hypothetical protein
MRSKDYSKRNKIAELWEEVAKEMGTTSKYSIYVG